MEGDFYSMEKTPNYQLNQWAMSDRIQMKDFNDDNTRLETALTGLETMKLGFEKVFDVSATLDKVSYWPVDISELHAGDSLAIFLLFSMSTSATYGLCLGQGRSYSTSVYAPVTAFMGWPLRNPGTPVVLLSSGNRNIKNIWELCQRMTRRESCRMCTGRWGTSDIFLLMPLAMHLPHRSTIQ